MILFIYYSVKDAFRTKITNCKMNNVVQHETRPMFQQSSEVWC